MHGQGRGGGRGKGEGTVVRLVILRPHRMSVKPLQTSLRIALLLSLRMSDLRVRIVQLKLLVSLLMYMTVACVATLLDKVLLAVIDVHAGSTQLKCVLGFLVMPSLPLRTSVGQQFCSSALTVGSSHQIELK